MASNDSPRFRVSWDKHSQLWRSKFPTSFLKNLFALLVTRVRGQILRVFQANKQRTANS